MNRKNFLRLLAGLSMVPFLPAPSTETPEINDQWMPGTEEDGTMRYWVYDYASNGRDFSAGVRIEVSPTTGIVTVLDTHTWR